jgi:hypothetical protein
VSSIKQSSGGEVDSGVAGPDRTLDDDEAAGGDGETARGDDRADGEPTRIGEPTGDTEDACGESSTEVGEGVSEPAVTAECVGDGEENTSAAGSSLAGQDGDSEPPCMGDSTRAGEVTVPWDHAGRSADTKDEAPSETTGGSDSLARHSAHSKGWRLDDVPLIWQVIAQSRCCNVTWVFMRIAAVASGSGDEPQAPADDVGDTSASAGSGGVGTSNSGEEPSDGDDDTASATTDSGSIDIGDKPAAAGTVQSDRKPNSGGTTATDGSTGCNTRGEDSNGRGEKSGSAGK